MSLALKTLYKNKNYMSLDQMIITHFTFIRSQNSITTNEIYKINLISCGFILCSWIKLDAKFEIFYFNYVW